MLKGKKIVLGITGSIAAYKACYIIRGLIKAGAEVQVVITPAGKEFITPITLSALTQKPVISDFFSQRDGTWHSHVALGLWADAMLIAPCTASTLGKMANGVAHFAFQKKDGSIREAFGTIQSNIAAAKTNGYGISRECFNTTAFFDIEKGEWRSLRWESLLWVA